MTRMGNFGNSPPCPSKWAATTLGLATITMWRMAMGVAVRSTSARSAGQSSHLGRRWEATWGGIEPRPSGFPSRMQSPAQQAQLPPYPWPHWWPSKTWRNRLSWHRAPTKQRSATCPWIWISTSPHRLKTIREITVIIIKLIIEKVAGPASSSPWWNHLHPRHHHSSKSSRRASQLTNLRWCSLPPLLLLGATTEDRKKKSTKVQSFDFFLFYLNYFVLIRIRNRNRCWQPHRSNHSFD